ncbi:MAG TPA: hypothetical protein VH914_10680 [Acidimicrobiia bacterium]|nr:hypothetical protein [Acidimicrobiia bacterium]
MIVGCATVVAWGGAGELLAYRGDYTLARAAILGSIGTLLGVVIAVVRERPVDRARVSPKPAIAMVLGAGAVALWNAVYAGHHVAGDRDPGIYALAGKWIAKHGNLVVPAGAGWPANVSQVLLHSGGTYDAPGRTVQFQFAHFLPSLLAEAQNIGGDGLMFRTNVLLGAAGLLALFAVGCRCCSRPWLVVAAVLGLGITIPELYTVRDSFSEPSTQFVLWSGILLVVIAFEAQGRVQRRHLGVALLGGAALGATVMTRIDGVAYLVFVPLLAAVGWISRADDAKRRQLLPMYAAVLVGIVPPVALGTLDVQRRSAGYYAALRHDVLSLWAACAAMAVVGLVLVAVWPRSGALRELVARERARVANVVVGVAVVGLTLAWAVRPAVQKLRWPSGPSSAPYIDINTQLQRQEGLLIDGLRTYGERSVEWLSWYLGPIALLLAIVGLAFVLARLIREPTPAIAVPLLIAGSLSAEYLWSPHVNGDQPWAMRRFVPAVLPLCALLAAIGLARAWDGVRIANRRAGHAAFAGVAVLALVGFPFGRAIPVRALTIEDGFPAAVEALCRGVGPNAAILTVPLDVHTVYTQTLRDWCNVPVAGLAAPVDASVLQALARSWQRQGRRLWLVSDSEVGVRGLARPPEELGAADSIHEIEITLARAPEQYVSKTVTFWAAPIA